MEEVSVLSLDDPRWGELRHAYGSAEDVPEMLRRLAAHSANAWNDVWSSLCHQGTRYSATYAAAPHIVEIASTLPPEQRVMFCAFLGEVAPRWPGRDLVPQDLEEDLERSLGRACELALETLLAGKLSESDTIHVLEAIAKLRGCIDDVYSEFDHALSDGEAVCLACSHQFTLPRNDDLRHG